MKPCQKCKGMTAEPGEICGYAGKWCDCQWKSYHDASFFIPLTDDKDEIIKNLKEENARLFEIIKGLIK